MIQRQPQQWMKGALSLRSFLPIKSILHIESLFKGRTL